MSNFTPENELLQATQLTYPPIRPLWETNSTHDVFQEEASFLADFVEEFDLMFACPSDDVMQRILNQLREEVIR
jgi:hypothetical protein